MGKSEQEAYWRQTAREYGAALERLAWAYEPDPDRRSDLLQEIHLALWRSFENFDARCSLRTWIYRVAHNVAISRVTRRKRNEPVFSDAGRASRTNRSPVDSGLPGRPGRGSDEPDHGALRCQRLDQNPSDQERPHPAISFRRPRCEVTIYRTIGSALHHPVQDCPGPPDVCADRRIANGGLPDGRRNRHPAESQDGPEVPAKTRCAGCIPPSIVDEVQDLLQVFPGFALGVLIVGAQQVRRMIRHHHRNIAAT